MGLLQQAGVQWPDPHVPLGSEVQFGNRGQRFPGAQSTGGPGEGAREQAVIPTHSLDLHNLPPTAQRVEGSQRELEPKLDVNPSFDTEFLTVCVLQSHWPSFCHFICPLDLFPDRGSKLRLLHWQADSSSLVHQGSPDLAFLIL